MAKRFVPIIIAVAMMVTAYVPLTNSFSYGAISVRTKLPSYTSAVGKAYYYSNNNIFYKYNYGPPKMNGGLYVTGNCTWYVYGRASELLGKPLNDNFRWNASAWWNINKRGNYYPYGSKPKVGAIICYDTHVAIVEKIVNGKVYVSESGWRRSYSKPTSASQISFNYGSPWKGTSGAKGYIYILDGSSSAKQKTVNYKVKITAEDLNMRTGPGGAYTSKGYIKPGTYTMVKECGDWGKIKEKGYWVYLDYVSRIASSSENVVNTGTSVSMKVKVTAEDLNMRTGPGTKYKSVGSIKPGTYKIKKKTGNWGKVSSNGYWINLKYTKTISSTTKNTTQKETAAAKKSTAVSYSVKVTAKELNMRTGPGTNYKTTGTVKKNAVYDIKAEQNGWGQLKKNSRWIRLSYTSKVKTDTSYKVKVKAKDLNMRTGPATSYKSKGYIKPGVYNVKTTKNGWGKLAKNGYWIKLSYAKKV